MASPRIFVNGIQDPRSPAAGSVLTSDASGNGSWQAPAAAGTADVESFAFFVGS